ncbi:hypothetical protein D1920_08380 [Rhodopseudomonas palustris]|nr:hypothetical protein D1920_08380 [Rhodopseudomonas palustris]
MHNLYVYIVIDPSNLEWIDSVEEWCPMPPPSDSQRPPRYVRPGDGGPVEAAQYLSEATGQLIKVAQAHRLDMLCYLLDMARMEAREIVRRRRNSSAE